MYSRLGLLVNTAHTQSQKHRGRLKELSVKRWYCCTSAVALLLVLLCYTAAVVVVCTSVPWLRGCLWDSEEVWLYVILPQQQLNRSFGNMCSFLPPPMNRTTGSTAHTHTHRSTVGGRRKGKSLMCDCCCTVAAAKQTSLRAGGTV